MSTARTLNELAPPGILAQTGNARLIEQMGSPAALAGGRMVPCNALTIATNTSRQAAAMLAHTLAPDDPYVIATVEFTGAEVEADLQAEALEGQRQQEARVTLANRLLQAGALFTSVYDREVAEHILESDAHSSCPRLVGSGLCYTHEDSFPTPARVLSIMKQLADEGLLDARSARDMIHELRRDFDMH
jgi:hypothetical protein